MEKQIIGRGLLAGALAGVLAFVFARIFVEPVIDRAIDFEDGVGAAHEAMHGGRPRARRRGVHPRRAGQHRHGFRGAGVQRRHGRVVRGGVRVAYGRVGNVSARAVVACWWPAECCSPVRRSRTEVPAESARRQPRRDDPAAHPALSADGRVVGGAVGRPRSTSAGNWQRGWAPGTRRWSAAGAYIVAVAVVMLILPTIDETPGPLRDDAGNIVYGASRPTISTSSGFSRWARRWSCGRPSGWCSRRWHRGCSTRSGGT